jgi:hypothetical protein
MSLALDVHVGGMPGAPGADWRFMPRVGHRVGSSVAHAASGAAAGDARRVACPASACGIACPARGIARLACGIACPARGIACPARGHVEPARVGAYPASITHAAIATPARRGEAQPAREPWGGRKALRPVHHVAGRRA